MIPYWLLLLIPVQASLSSRRNVWSQPLIITLWLVLSLFIGLRHEVGGDWFAYLPYVDRAEGLSLGDLLEWGDPGYNILNWVFAHTSAGIYGVNLVSGMIFSAGLLCFCKEQPRPWLSLTLSIPYLVIVVAMGYSRQGVALGFAMPGLLALEKGRLRAFIGWIAAAATFHSTALIMLAFVVPAVPGKSIASRLARLALLVLSCFFLVQTFLASNVDQFISGYIDTSYQSEGAAIRVVMNLIPALLILVKPRAFRFSHQQLRLWISLSITAVGCALALVVLSENTTAVDRIALYVIPIQLVVASRLPETYFLRLRPIQITILVLVYASLVQYVWLNYAVHADSWLPYRSIIEL